jgi:integrase
MNTTTQCKTSAWNKGRLVGQKLPLRVQDVWAIRVRLQVTNNLREIALFDLALDSKLRSCDLVAIKISDICHGSTVSSRATVMQQKTHTPVQFEITEQTRKALSQWIYINKLKNNDYLFPSRLDRSSHLSTRQYARIVKRWISSIGLDATRYGTHSMRRTKVSIIYRQTKNLRAIQLLLGHKKLESTVRYLGIEVDDALEISEKLDI